MGFLKVLSDLQHTAFTTSRTDEPCENAQDAEYALTEWAPSQASEEDDALAHTMTSTNQLVMVAYAAALYGLLKVINN